MRTQSMLCAYCGKPCPKLYTKFCGKKCAVKEANLNWLTRDKKKLSKGVDKS